MKRSVVEFLKASQIKRRKLNKIGKITYNNKRTYKVRSISDVNVNEFSNFIAIKENNLDIEYYPNFYTNKEATKIFNDFERNMVYNTDEQSSVVVYGKKHKISRKQCAYGIKGTKYTFSGHDVLARNWDNTDIILDIKNKIENVIHQTFNFVLINRYKDGNDKIGAHKDDQKDIKETSSIVGVSFGVERDIIFKHESIVRQNKKSDIKDDNDAVKVVKISLKPGSVFVMKYPTNHHWYHEIPKRARINKARISLTFRDMLV